MEKYRNLQAIRKLRQAAYKLWRVSIQMVDADGTIEDASTLQACSLCQLSLKEGNIKDYAGYLQKIGTQSKTQSSARIIKHRCASGLEAVAFPIIMNGKSAGYALAEGFITEQISDTDKKKIIKSLSHLPLNDADLSSAIDEAPKLSHENINALQSFLQMIGEEILYFQRDMKGEVSHSKARIQKGESEGSESAYGFDTIIGQSEPMQEIYSLLRRVVKSDTTVMIQGESGTGKELLAKAVHYNSNRKHRPFVVANCSAFNDNLLESELFGHVKGAFTGAIRDKKGLFEVADGGTFFLDEIGDMSMTLQVKLLRVLQEGTFMSVGGTKQKKVDVRIVAATNRDLSQMVRDGQFREDLYYRINVINVRLPSLRQRKDDIPLLIQHFITKHGDGMLAKTLTEDAIEALANYEWPGNIRELENEIERALVLSAVKEEIEEHVLSVKVRQAGDEAQNSLMPDNINANTLPEAVEQIERHMILEGLKQNAWNKSKLARKLGISRRNLIRKIARYELEKRRLQ